MEKEIPSSIDDKIDSVKSVPHQDDFTTEEISSKIEIDNDSTSLNHKSTLCEEGELTSKQYNSNPTKTNNTPTKVSKTYRKALLYGGIMTALGSASIIAFIKYDRPIQALGFALSTGLFALGGAEYFKEIYQSYKEKLHNVHAIRKQHKDFDNYYGPPRSIAEVVYRDEKRIRVRGSCIIG